MNMNENSIIKYIICMITTFKKASSVKLSYIERILYNLEKGCKIAKNTSLYNRKNSL